MESFVGNKLALTDAFLVDLRISPANEIVVEIDSPTGVDIDYCMELSRAIEEAFPREEEDYELEVGSAGLTSPFKVRGQYEKNVGNKVEVLTRDGRKLHGVLASVSDEGFKLLTKTKEKPDGAKRPVEREVKESFPFDSVKSVRYEFEF